MNSLLFNNVSIFNLNFSNESTFIELENDSRLEFFQTPIFSNNFNNSNFLHSGAKTIISLIQCQIFQNTLITFSSESYSFFSSEYDFVMVNSTLENNTFSNYTFLLTTGDNESVCLINSSIISNNVGDLTIFSINGQGVEVILEDLTVVGNNLKESLIIIQETFAEVIINSVVFEENSANIIINLYFVGDVTINSLKFQKNNENTDNNIKEAGPCLKIEEMSNLRIEQLEISDNFAISNIPGIVIIQSNYIPDFLQINSSIITITICLSIINLNKKRSNSNFD